MGWNLKTIERLRKQNMTLDRLALLVAADEPLPLASLAEKAGVSKRMVEKFLDEEGGFLKRVPYSEKRNYREGRPVSVAVVRTKKAERILDSL